MHVRLHLNMAEKANDTLYSSREIITTQYPELYVFLPCWF